jgi:hypothetical protein
VPPSAIAAKPATRAGTWPNADAALLSSGDGRAIIKASSGPRVNAKPTPMNAVVTMRIGGVVCSMSAANANKPAAHIVAPIAAHHQPRSPVLTRAAGQARRSVITAGGAM